MKRAGVQGLCCSLYKRRELEYVIIRDYCFIEMERDVPLNTATDACSTSLSVLNLPI
jgi:hypothetical protein